RYAQRSFNLLRNSPDRIALGTAIENVGILQTEMGLYGRSRRNQRAGLAASQISKIRTAVCGFLVNIGETYRAQGHWRRALEHYHASLSGTESSGASATALIITGNIAHVLSHLGHANEALSFLKHSFARSRRFGLTGEVFSIYVPWAAALLAIGRFAVAHRLASRGCRRAETSQLRQWILELRRHMAIAMWSMGKLEGA